MNGIYFFDSFTAEMFYKILNDLIHEYGSVSVSDFFDKLEALCPSINEEDQKQFMQYQFTKYGWGRPFKMAELFVVNEICGSFVYTLKLPMYKEL